MDEKEFKDRTKKFALRIIRVVDSLPKNRIAAHIGGQLLRAGTSVPANYRAACRARSVADIIAKLGVVEEETDESMFWMEMLVDCRIVKAALLAGLIQEGHEILAMTVSFIKTLRSKRDRMNSPARSTAQG